MDTTQFDMVISSLVLRTRADAGEWVSFGVNGRYSIFSDATIANFESLETKVSHNDTYQATPWVTIHLPTGPLKQLDVRGSVDFFSVGETAIASQEFAFAIPRLNTLRRFNAGVSTRIDNLGLSVDYYWVTGSNDPIEFAYQAPWLTRDYVLSPRTLTAEVSWYF